jgi:hypothetical protein
VSPLKTVAEMLKESAVVVEPGTPTVLGCTYVTVPPEGIGQTAATIRPIKSYRNCFTDFAVTFFTDDDGKVNTIQFALDGP